MTVCTEPSADRRRRSREARDAFPPMGIYLVRDRTSGQVRVGASRDVHASLNRIRFELRLGSHPDKLLQAQWKHEPAGFTFEILELVAQRPDPSFDYEGELQALLQLHREHLAARSLP